MKKEKKFPKKAKLISVGGLYRIVPIKGFSAIISLPVLRKIRVNLPDIDWSDTWSFELKFSFDRVYRGYAEYQQIDTIKIL